MNCEDSRVSANLDSKLQCDQEDRIKKECLALMRSGSLKADTKVNQGTCQPLTSGTCVSYYGGVSLSNEVNGKKTICGETGSSGNTIKIEIDSNNVCCVK